MLDSKGMFPKDGEVRPELLNYLVKTLKGVILGDLLDEATALSTVVNIISGIFGTDFLADLRDIAADIIKLSVFGNTQKTWIELILNTIAIIPVVGSLKYLDEVVDVANPVVKNSDEAVEIAKKVLKNSDDAANAGKAVVNSGDKVADIGKAAVKGSDEAGDIGKAIIKSSDEVADVSTEVVKESLELSLKNIDEFIAGNKSFEDVLDDYAKIYAHKVNSNVIWSWNDDIKGIGKSEKNRKKLIKQWAIDNAYIPDIKITKITGMKYGFADFAAAGVVKETVNLPENMWKMTDWEQFKWLDEQIGGTVKGYTWHHTEIPGKMELVPYGIHNITRHNGGRSAGMWSDAPR